MWIHVNEDVQKLKSMMWCGVLGRWVRFLDDGLWTGLDSEHRPIGNIWTDRSRTHQDILDS